MCASGTNPPLCAGNDYAVKFADNILRKDTKRNRASKRGPGYERNRVMEIKIVQNILHANDEIANENQAIFDSKGIVGFNLMSSPGSGKTYLLDTTLAMLAGELRAAVIEGDISTTLDAERLARHNVPLIQINTDTVGGDCHLEASMVKAALPRLDIEGLNLLFIENVGNLVCPADFDLGEHIKVALLSTTEGEDKPLKYPLMFRVCHVILITKIDLEGVLEFDTDKAEANARKINPNATVIRLSAKSGQGMDKWIDFLRAEVAKRKKP